MKLRIELSCTESNLHMALIEARKVMQSMNGTSCQIKVFYSENRDPDKGHAWVTLTEGCDIMDKIEIYNLKKQLSETTKSEANEAQS